MIYHTYFKFLTYTLVFNMVFKIDYKLKYIKYFNAKMNYFVKIYLVISLCDPILQDN
jgi:hypothetical protein